MQRPRLAFVGAGAVGGYVGGHLHRLGHDVTLIDPWPEHVEAIRARGLELTGVTEAERAVVEVPTMHLTEVQSLAKQRPVDVAFVSVKSYDTEWATHLIAPYLSETGYVVSLQNCINEERIAAIVGWGRTVGMIAATISVDLFEAGRVRRTVPLGGKTRTVFRVGEVHGRITPRVEALGEMVAGIDSVKVTSNLWGERWSKLCVNAMRNGISAATGLSGNDCDRDEAIRRFSIRIGSRACDRPALGYSLERIQNIEPERLALAGEATARRWRKRKRCCSPPPTPAPAATSSAPPWARTC
jgi:2-dehydropantoate 2-reductase